MLVARLLNHTVLLFHVITIDGTYRLEDIDA